MRRLSHVLLCTPQAAVCYYHMNNFAKAYTVFERTVEQARLADAKDLECIALSNMAVLENCMLRSKVCGRGLPPIVSAALSCPLLPHRPLSTSRPRR